LLKTAVFFSKSNSSLSNLILLTKFKLGQDPMTIKLRPPPGNFYARAAAWEAPIEAVIHSCPQSTVNSQMLKGLNGPWNMKGCLHGDMCDSTNVSSKSVVSDNSLESLGPHHVCQTASTDLGAFQVASSILQHQPGDSKGCSLLQNKSCLNHYTETGRFSQISPTVKMASCARPDERACQSPDSAQVLACSTPTGKQQDVARREMEEILILLRQGLTAGLGLDDGQVCRSFLNRLFSNLP
jgi:hypothetical protein